MGKTLLSTSSSEIRDTQRLFLKILLFIPLLLLVLAVNIQIDPADLYRNKTDKYKTPEYQVALALAAGRDMTINFPIDDRLLQKYFVEDLTAAPDTVVLGSSRSSWLGDNIFPDQKVINNSVLDAILADYLGIFEGYAKRNLYPKRVILVLDPQLIGYPLASVKWVSTKEDTYGMLDRLDISSEKIKAPLISQAWLNVFSFSYFQKSMKKWRDEHSRVGNDSLSDGQLLFRDGRRVWDMRFLSRGTEEGRWITVRELYHGPWLQLLRSQMRPDKDLEDVLERFIRYLMGHHIQVTLYLLPLHPQLYHMLLEPQKTPEVSNIVGFENYYHALAQKLNLKIIGSYDPAVYDLDGNDFYDGEHIRNETIEKIFKQKASL
jgi:hypothetical protein